MQTTSIVEVVGYKRIKAEHAGAKNGGGAWMMRAEAKASARRRRRQVDKQSAEPPKEPWTDHDPQPGAFDTQSGLIEIHDGNPRARLVILDIATGPKGADR